MRNAEYMCTWFKCGKIPQNVKGVAGMNIDLANQARVKVGGGDAVWGRNPPAYPPFLIK